MPSTLRGASRAQARLTVVLAMTAGYVDAYSLITYGTYVSFMSGNTTQTGSEIGQGHIVAAATALLAIVFFVMGVFTGTLFSHSGVLQSERRLFGLLAALLAAVIALTQLDALATGTGIAALSLAMGFMNTALSRVGTQSVNLVFVTGTLNTMAQHFALAVTRAPLMDARGSRDTHTRRAFLLLSIWGAFVTGALLAGAATSRLGAWVLLLPLLILLTLAAFNPARTSDDDR